MTQMNADLITAKKRKIFLQEKTEETENCLKTAKYTKYAKTVFFNHKS